MDLQLGVELGCLSSALATTGIYSRGESAKGNIPYSPKY